MDVMKNGLPKGKMFFGVIILCFVFFFIVLSLDVEAEISTYNLSVEHENVDVWAYDTSYPYTPDWGQIGCITVPTTTPVDSCLDHDVTLENGFDTSDNHRVQDNSWNAAYLFKVNLTERAADITHLNWTIEIRTDFAGDTISLYVWNTSGNKYDNYMNQTQAGNTDYTLNASITNNITNFVNSTGFVHLFAWARNLYGNTMVEVDFLKLEVTYNVVDLNIISPTEGENFTNDKPTAYFNISTGLNMSKCFYTSNKINYSMTRLNYSYYYSTNRTMRDGLTNVTFWCNATSDGNWYSEGPINFFVDSKNITTCRNLTVSERAYELLSELNTSNANCLNIIANDSSLDCSYRYVNASSTSIAIFPGANRTNISRCIMGNSRAGITIEPDIQNHSIASIYNSSFRYIFTDNLSIDSGGTLYLYNTTHGESIGMFTVGGFPDGKELNSRAYIYWYFEAEANNSETYVTNANATIFDKDELKLYSELTGTKGNITRKTLLEKLVSLDFTAGLSTNYTSPYTLNITQTYYQTNSTTYNLTEENNVYAYISMNYNSPTLDSVSISNYTNLHWFSIVGDFTDTDGADTIVNQSFTTSGGTCLYKSNATIGNSLLLKYNCTGTPLQNISVNMTVEDNTGMSVTTGIYSNKIPNVKPTLLNASINSSNPTVTEPLECLNGTVEDLDGDTVTLFYNWYNGTDWINKNNRILNASNTTVGDNWKCKITPSDSYQNGTARESPSVSIGTGYVAPIISRTNATTTITEYQSNTQYPTNNDSWVNLNVTFTDANTKDIHTAFYCTTDSATQDGCTISSYCNTDVNISGRLNCTYDVSGETSTILTYYVFVLDNTSLLSSSAEGNFTVNYPPTKPTIISPTADYYTRYNWTNISFSSTDSDGDIINYSVYNSTDDTTWQLLFNLNTTYNWTNLQDGTYYLKAVAYDEHNHSRPNSTSTNVTVDTVKPNANISSPIQDEVYDSETITIRMSTEDLHLDVCNYTVFYKDTLALRQEGTSDCNGAISTKIPSFSPGYVMRVYAFDKAGNNNMTEINFTIESGTGPGGGSPGGPGGAPPANITEEIVEQIETSLICGNGICQEGENPLNCPQDCPLNVDEIFCWIGDKECAAWVFNALFYFIIIAIGWTLYKRQTT